MRHNKTADATGLAEDQQENAEVAPGITIERRFFLRGSTLAAVAFLLMSAKKLLALKSKKTLRHPDRIDFEEWIGSLSSGDPTWEEFIGQTVPLAQAAPGAVFPPHNHPNYSVCTLGLEGETCTRNYEIVGDAPEFSSRRRRCISRLTRWRTARSIHSSAPQERKALSTWRPCPD